MTLTDMGLEAKIATAVALLERIQNEFRWQVLVKSDLEKDPSAHQMRATLDRVAKFFHKANRNARVRMIVDVDPISML